MRWDRKWFDELGLPRAFYGQDSVNGLLFLAYAIMTGALIRKRGHILPILEKHVKTTPRPYQIKQTWRDSENERIGSHDEMTAFVALCLHYNIDFHHELDLSPYKHPRDFAWYRMARGVWWLTPIYSLIAITTCFRKQFNKKANQFDTDGKLLYILRRTVLPLPTTDFICDKLLSWRWGKFYVHTLFDIYFHHSPAHPIRETLKGYDYV